MHERAVTVRSFPAHEEKRDTYTSVISSPFETLASHTLSFTSLTDLKQKLESAFANDERPCGLSFRLHGTERKPKGFDAFTSANRYRNLSQEGA